MVSSFDISFALHENVRKNHLQNDGSYSQKWKKVIAKEFVSQFETRANLPPYLKRTSDGELQINVNDAGFNQLSPTYKNEAKSSAKTIMQILQNEYFKDKQYSPAQIGSFIYKELISRNQWMILDDPSLNCGFSELPEKKQDKILLQYEIAKSMQSAKKISLDFNNLEDIASSLAKFKEKGENVYFRLDGINLYSEFDNLNTIYLKVVNVSYPECQRMKKEDGVIFEKEQKDNQNYYVELMESAMSATHPLKRKKLLSYMKKEIENPYKAKLLKQTIAIMDALADGMSVKEINDTIDILFDSNNGSGKLMNMIALFSERGPEYVRSNIKKILASEDEYLKTIEKKNQKLNTIPLSEEDMIEPNKTPGVPDNYSYQFPYWLTRARRITHPSKFKEFEEYLIKASSVPSKAIFIFIVLDVMEALENGLPCHDVYKIASKGIIESNIEMIAKFSRRGPEFVRENDEIGVEYSEIELRQIEGRNTNLYRESFKDSYCSEKCEEEGFQSYSR